MDYQFFKNSIDKNNLVLPNSDKISPILLKNNYNDILKAIDFIDSDKKFLYIHGFLGTGKRQFINYVCDFLESDVIKLEYYCKEATVCDDILLYFNDLIEKLPISKAVNFNTKIAALNIKFQQQLSSIKKPFVIVLHSLDDVLEENLPLIIDCFSKIINESNVKIIISTRAMIPSLLGESVEECKIFLKALTKDNFKLFLKENKIDVPNTTIDDFYKYTRGYYYYTALSIKIIEAMKIDINEFLLKYNQSGMSFDSFIGLTYINLIPNTIRNFFWFLRTIRHGLSLNALAIFELYDEFAIEYLKANLMIFVVDDIVFVQDYFLQKIDISIPEKTEIKLHKYIIGIYEKQLKESLKSRAIYLSRQALRAEIEYHNSRIDEILSADQTVKNNNIVQTQPNIEESTQIVEEKVVSIQSEIEMALNLATDKKYTDAISLLRKVIEKEDIDLPTLVEARLHLAKLYKAIESYSYSSNFYELVETYYKQHKEYINLNYLYYDMTDLYYKMYKHERAIETIKKVIYSVDTPQSLMVSACTLLGNIYSDLNNSEEAYSYYSKALESLDDNDEDFIVAEVYFKYALANDDMGNENVAFDYYNKCIMISGNNPYKALSYSNMAACYLDNGNLEDASVCFEKAYNIEKQNNNFDGIYYNASHLAKIYIKNNTDKALQYLLEAKKSAEFINEDYYILKASIALGDFYYNNPSTYKESLTEYFKARNLAKNSGTTFDMNRFQQRINDMKLRMDQKDFEKIEKKYGAKF